MIGESGRRGGGVVFSCIMMFLGGVRKADL